jgi:transposase
LDQQAGSARPKDEGRKSVNSHAGCLKVLDTRRHAKRIALESFPAYSPESNPIERVWKSNRRRYLHNHHFPQLERVIETVEWEFAVWARHSEILRRLCAIL